MKVKRLLETLAAEEAAFAGTEFLAPVLPGRRVRVRIAGLVCALRVVGESAPGWAILRALSLETAQVVGRPGLQQIRDYLALFPAVRLLLLTLADDDWLALPAQRNNTRVQVPGPVRVHLAVGVQRFQQIIARFDGLAFWFQEVDRRHNPARAAYLRDVLAAELPPAEVRKPYLTAEERAAYQLVYDAREAARRDQVEARLADALAHAGASLAAYIEREDAYTVTYTVEGQLYHSTVRKDDLTVLSAGICLSGQDRSFDLQSLVGVIREGREQWLLGVVGGEN